MRRRRRRGGGKEEEREEEEREGGEEEEEEEERDDEEEERRRRRRRRRRERRRREREEVRPQVVYTHTHTLPDPEALNLLSETCFTLQAPLIFPFNTSSLIFTARSSCYAAHQGNRQ